MMTTQNHRRSSFSASTTKRPSPSATVSTTLSSHENVMSKVVHHPIIPLLPPSSSQQQQQQQPKKRVALSNLTNQTNVSRISSHARNQAPSGATIIKTKKKEPSFVRSTSLTRTFVSVPSSVKTNEVGSAKDTSLARSDKPISSGVSFIGTCKMGVSPSRSDGGSVSMDETMSTCDSLKSPDVEYVDNLDASAVASIERKASNYFHISEHMDAEAGKFCKRDILTNMETNDEILYVDNNLKDPQLCATIACDIYKHLRASEHKRRPSTNFMEGVQKDINVSMRSILIDWLVEVAEEYRLVPETLYLTVNYIDRYLSGNVMNRQKLQLLGIACMMIASKYEEICAPQVEEFCYITDNTYFKEEVLQMESNVLNYLKFEMTAATVKDFLRRFIQAAHRTTEVPPLQLECLANYAAELSLLEYSMLCYSPSLIAASAIFLARYILVPAERPWNATLGHYTLYKPSQLCECVKALHRLLCSSHNSSLPAIREKYSQHKYKFVAKKHCPPSIPSDFFKNLSTI